MASFPQIIRSLFMLMVCFSFSYGAYAENPAPPSSPVVVAKVVWVKGKLNAINQNKQVRPLEKADSIYLHDTLVADDKTEAQIVFTDDTLMSFRPGSELYINDYSYNPKAAKGSVGKYIMNLIKGGFRTITGLIAKANPSDYKVNTPVATIGVRGTDYTVYLNKEGGVYMSYTSGSPCVTSTSTLCLDKSTPYAQVRSLNTNPIPLTRQPAVFAEKPTMLKTTFSNVVQGIAPSPTPIDSNPSGKANTSNGISNDQTHTSSTDNSASTEEVNKSSPESTSSSSDTTANTSSSTEVTPSTTNNTIPGNTSDFCIK